MPDDKAVQILGIDLGTTNTCIGYVRNRLPRVVPSDKGALLLPSVVALTEQGDLLVGQVAKDQMVVNPKNTIHGAKRLIGRKFQSSLVQGIRARTSYEVVEGSDGGCDVLLGGKQYSLPQISALVLAQAKRMAEAFLGHPVNEAVISVPAYYNDNQRAAVKEAGRLAGFNVRRIVNEPTAAALAYGFNRGFEKKILVYDLGGGTFDVSVLQLHGNVFEVLATGGDTFLGGVDFDNRVIDYVLETFKRESKIDLADNNVVLQRIKGAAESAKMDLSLVPNAVIELPYVERRKGKPVDLRIPLSREKLNQLTLDLVERTLQIVDEVLGQKNLSRDSIAEVLLVGGQTRMPLVQGKIHAHFARPPRKGVHPDEVVSLGASLLADSLDRIDSVTLVDVLSMPIGIALSGGRFKAIIEKNTSIPHIQSFRLPAPRPGEPLELDVFQGDAPRIVDNEYLGTLRFPLSAVGQKVNFHLDEECLLRITVEGLEGAHPVVLATRDTPESLKRAWAEDREKSRVEAITSGEGSDKGLLSSIKRLLGGSH